MTPELLRGITHLCAPGCFAFVVVGLRVNPVTGKSETNTIWPDNFQKDAILEMLRNGIEQIEKEGIRHAL